MDSRSWNRLQVLIVKTIMKINLYILIVTVKIFNCRITKKLF